MSEIPVQYYSFGILINGVIQTAHTMATLIVTLRRKGGNKTDAG